MPKNGPFPSKEAELNLYFQTAAAYVLANTARLLVSPANKTALSTEIATWNIIFPQAQNNSTRTKTIIMNKDNAKENLIVRLRTIYADVPESVWTSEDRVTLNIGDRNASKTPKPVPSTKPIAQINTSQRLEHTISFINEDGTTAKPDGVRGCQIWFKIGEPITDISELSFMATDTASPYVYRFKVEDSNKNVYYWLRWENTRGETGPWGDVIMATITG